MDTLVDNQQKYEYYRAHMGRLKSELHGRFYPFRTAGSFLSAV